MKAAVAVLLLKIQCTEMTINVYERLEKCWIFLELIDWFSNADQHCTKLVLKNNKYPDIILIKHHFIRLWRQIIISCLPLNMDYLF